ncbi:MAG TPA: hypothetical protein VI386_19045, partial [Candidatus Sulfotelmatobacter sp.]
PAVVLFRQQNVRGLTLLAIPSALRQKDKRLERFAGDVSFLLHVLSWRWISGSLPSHSVPIKTVAQLG